MRWLCPVLVALGCACATAAQDLTVRIGVLGMFHPRFLRIANGKDRDLVVFFENRRLFVRPRSSCSIVELRAADRWHLPLCSPMTELAIPFFGALS